MVGYVVFDRSSGIAAAKSHPHNLPLVVCSTKRTVQTGVQSESSFSMNYSRLSIVLCFEFCLSDLCLAR